MMSGIGELLDRGGAIAGALAGDLDGMEDFALDYGLGQAVDRAYGPWGRWGLHVGPQPTREDRRLEMIPGYDAFEHNVFTSASCSAPSLGGPK